MLWSFVILSHFGVVCQEKSKVRLPDLSLYSIPKWENMPHNIPNGHKINEMAKTC
jgi:hypothetical protein